MSIDELGSKSFSSLSQEHPGFQEFAQGAEPDLSFDPGKQTETMVARPSLRGLFASQSWHKPYAEALLATDPERAKAAVTAAKRAILNRYLELCTTRNGVDEPLDLKHALDSLRDLSLGETKRVCS
jgi:hypothetical protein